MSTVINAATTFRGEPVIPGDKSLSHRAELLAGLAEGTSHIAGISNGEDVTTTRRCLTDLGVRFRPTGEGAFEVVGVGSHGLSPSPQPLNCGNSGSTIRMLMGVLSGLPFPMEMFGDGSLSRRPMKRVADPLTQMGADFTMTEGTYPPLTVHGSATLKAIDYELKIASAQVKSAILLAALFAKGTTRLTGKIQSRDHTERLLPHFGVKIGVTATEITLVGGQALTAADYSVPGDPSSAAFWLAGACIVPNGKVKIKKLLLNPTRTGFQKVLRRMGARITETVRTHFPEPVGDVEITGSALKGVTVRPDEVASLIDELPMLAVLACYAEGVTEVRGAEELRVKETDRIEAVATNLRKMGAEITTFDDGFRIEGRQPLRGAIVDSFHDHRIAMAFAIGALGASEPTTIERADSVNISYPAFFETLARLSRG